LKVASDRDVGGRFFLRRVVAFAKNPENRLVDRALARASWGAAMLRPYMTLLGDRIVQERKLSRSDDRTLDEYSS